MIDEDLMAVGRDLRWVNPSDQYFYHYLYNQKMAQDQRDKIAITIRMAGIAAAYRIYGQNQTLAVRMFHPAFRKV